MAATNQRARTSTTRWGHLYRRSRWTRESLAFRSSPEGALCVLCKARGRIVPSECVDHHPPHNGDEAKFWDRGTWRPLCWSCHSSATLAHRAGKPHRIRGCDRTGQPLDPSHPWHQDGAR